MNQHYDTNNIKFYGKNNKINILQLKNKFWSLKLQKQTITKYSIGICIYRYTLHCSYKVVKVKENICVWKLIKKKKMDLEITR